MDEELFQGLTTELRRGTLTLAVLSCLSNAQYGYSLLQEIESKGVRIEANTLYPLLRRLEGQGLLESTWDTDGSRPRKYYRLNNKGIVIYEKLKEEWRRISHEINNILFREDGKWNN